MTTNSFEKLNIFAKVIRPFNKHQYNKCSFSHYADKNTKLGVDANGNILINPNATNDGTANAKRLVGLARGEDNGDAVNVQQMNAAFDNINNRLQYINQGSAGSVVLTDDNGERVTPVKNDGNTVFYHIEDIRKEGLRQVIRPNAKGEDETVFIKKTDYAQWQEELKNDPNKPFPEDKIVNIHDALAGKTVDPNKITLSTVNADGSAQNPEKLGNIASALSLPNMSVNKKDGNDDTTVNDKVKANKGLAPINPDGKPNLDNITKAKEAIAGDDGKGGIYGVNGRDLYKATTLGDLQAVAAAGLTFNVNETVTDNSKNIHRPLGTFINIIGKEIPTKAAYDVATYQGHYTADNIITTIKDSNTIQIQFKDNPEFASLDLVQRDKDPKSKGKVLNRINMTIGGENGDKLVFGGGNDPDPANNNKPVVLSGVKEDPKDPNSVLTRESLKGIDDQIDKKIGKFNDDLNSRFDDIAQGASAGTASAMAAAGVPQIINVDAQNLIGVGFGNYNGERAIAIGYTGTNKDRDVIYRLTGTYDSSKKFGLSAGVGFTFGKKTSYKEDQIVRENNFYEIIQRQQFEIASLRDMNAKNQEEIAELKAQIKLILEKQK